MSAMSDFLEEQLNDRTFGDSSIFTNFYVGFSTADPTDDGSGIAEPSGNNYSQVEYNPGSARWSFTSGSGVTTNVNAIRSPTASGSWGTITHFFINEENGNLVVHGPLTTPTAVDSNQAIEFEAGELDLTWD